VYPLYYFARQFVGRNLEEFRGKLPQENDISFVRNLPLGHRDQDAKRDLKFLFARHN
jgi:hypothetical protein